MMRVPKITACFAAAVISFSCLQFPYPEVTTASAATGEFTEEEIRNSAVKPKISLPKIVITEDEAKKNPDIQIALKVEGAAKKFGTIELWTSFDKRLTIPKKTDERPAAIKGGTLQYFDADLCYSRYIDGKTNKLTDLNGVRLIASAGGNYGTDGELFSVNVKLPGNVKAGDEFPLEIVYVDHDTANNKYVNTLFTNQKNDDDGRLMQAWALDYGISNGYIRITDGNEPASSDDFLPGDANLDKDVTLADALCIMQFVANSQKYKLESQALDNSDVYERGGGITAADALSIQKLDAKLIKSLPESYKK